jgi:hypothetical protein
MHEKEKVWSSACAGEREKETSMVEARKKLMHDRERGEVAALAST